jgi:rare lipoprotein A
VLALAAATGCSGHKQTKVNVPPPPRISETQKQSAANTPPPPTPPKPAESEGDSDLLSVLPDAKAIFTETGVASWYGPPYHNRRGSNGEIYNMHALTAAHRTLPLGSIVRVTNLKTGNSTLVRITDRGPFIQGRIVDLSLAAAKKVDVWQAGLARVRVDVLKTPAALETGGKWAVQIGGFDDQQSADKIADHLTRKYRSAKVLRFASPTGDWWVRVRVKDDDKRRAQEVAQTTETRQGSVFLVRLD